MHEEPGHVVLRREPEAMNREVRVVHYDPLLVKSAHFSGDTEVFLLQNGLPLLEPDEAVLGVCFQSFAGQGLIQAGEQQLLPIGYEWDSETAILGLATGTGHVYSFHPATGQLGFINSDIQLFLAFLSCIHSFVSSQSEDEQATLMTFEEAQERLAAFRRGEVVPKPRKRQPFDREAELARIRARFQKQDARSFADENDWWSCVLEQLEDGVL